MCCLSITIGKWHTGVKSMEERNKNIVSLYDGGKTFMEIGDMYKLSYQRIIQIYAKQNKEKYSRGTYQQELKNVNELKIWSLRKRESLGITGKIVGIYNGGRNYIRELVRIRDNHTCQKCNKKWVTGERRFDVHHIDPNMEGKSKIKNIVKLDKENFDKMITYCHKCHFSEHSVRERIKKGINK